MTNLLDVFLQFLDASHVVLIFYAEGDWFSITTRPIKLKGTGVSVHILHQELACILSQQPAKQRFFFQLNKNINNIMSVNMLSQLNKTYS